MCPSIQGTQEMLNVCEKYANTHKIKFNSFNTRPPGPGGHGNQLMYGPPHAGGVTSGFRFGITNDKILQFAASFN